MLLLSVAALNLLLITLYLLSHQIYLKIDCKNSQKQFVFPARRRTNYIILYIITRKRRKPGKTGLHLGSVQLFNSTASLSTYRLKQIQCVRNYSESAFAQRSHRSTYAGFLPTVEEYVQQRMHLQPSALSTCTERPSASSESVPPSPSTIST